MPLHISLAGLEGLAERAKVTAQKAAAMSGVSSAAVGEAARELDLAETSHLRRSGVPGSIDNKIFAFGSAEQMLAGMDICPVALAGLKAAGTHAYPWLVAAAQRMPSGTFVDHVRIVLEDDECRHFCVRLGAYHRFQWKRAVYEQSVQEWKTSPAATDRQAAWRRRPVSVRQRYLIAEIRECLRAVEPCFDIPTIADRGEAHDWIAAAGGNPVFWTPPKNPKP